MWTALWKKEWQESIPRFAVIMGILLLAYAAMIYFAFNGSGYSILLGFLSIGLHTVFLFLVWALSFHGEWKGKTQWTWLNIPASGWKLVTSKLAVGFTQFLISVVLLTVVGFWTLSLFGEHAQQVEENGIAVIFDALWALYPLLIGLLMSVGVTLGLGAVFTILMMRIIKPFGWAVGIAVWGVFVYAIMRFTQTPVYEAMFRHGQLFDAEAQLQEAVVGNATFQLEVDEGIYLFAGEIAFELLAIAAVIVLFSWLVDRFVQA
ncbi:hypothetical protein [Alkalicoccus luteus]|uniref:Uncharacterized protein n=1 Tax=Alkalicoccus luteus TaxID=1237094 RepID=A0A969PT70_9BACI|nr:hypothetical protein [Alkalicoccus luteus]NJP38654.1 hypothetical protein [Alkalicoccus luteus]